MAAVYLMALLLESGVLGLGQFTASQVALQRRFSGAPLDDVIVTGLNEGGESATLHLQVKSTLHIGDGPSDVSSYRRNYQSKRAYFAGGTAMECGMRFHPRSAI